MTLRDALMECLSEADPVAPREESRSRKCLPWKRRNADSEPTLVEKVDMSSQAILERFGTKVVKPEVRLAVMLAGVLPFAVVL